MGLVTRIPFAFGRRSCGFEADGLMSLSRSSTTRAAGCRPRLLAIPPFKSERARAIGARMSAFSGCSTTSVEGASLRGTPVCPQSLASGLHERKAPNRRAGIVVWRRPQGMRTSRTRSSPASSGRRSRVWVYVRDVRPFGGRDPPAALFYASRERRSQHTPCLSIRPCALRKLGRRHSVFVCDGRVLPRRAR